MFGNLRVKSCGLPKDDSRFYKASFCTTCHAMHKFGGWWSSLATNYDINLWLTLAQALDTRPLHEVKAPCTALPLRSVRVYQIDPKVGATAAAWNLALIGAKIKDNRDDGSAAWSVADSAFSAKRAKAERYLEALGFPVERIRDLPRRQKEVESAVHPGLEALSEPTRQVMADGFGVLSELLEHPQLRPDLERLGRALGGYLYLWDAVEDRQRDKRAGQFNALESTGLDDAAVRSALLQELSCAGELLSRLPLQRHDKLFWQLLKSLHHKVENRFPRAGSDTGLRRPVKAQAAFLRTQDCDCCECGCDDCCELDFCPCDGDGCGLECCDCNICCCCGGDDD